MPDQTTYLDPSVVGFNHQDALDLKVDTYKRLAPILNTPNDPAIGPDFGNNLSILTDGQNSKIPVDTIDLGQALISSDPNIKSMGQDYLKSEYDKVPEYKFDLGRNVESPYGPEAKKFMTKDFGYSALRDNEDFYYRNVYMQHGWFMRNVILNPAKFLGRIAGQAILKFGEGFGYVGSMLTSIGSDNYWANVADNSLSNYLENAEQNFKDQWLPVYKKAGFDQQGFFSKLTDWSFWNDSVADSVAFMASALIPAGAFGRVGKIGALVAEGEEAIGAVNAFSRPFTGAVGRFAGKVGLGSWAQLSSWTYNTASEAAFEASQVYQDDTRRMKALRDRGVAGYANLSDDDIKERAGRLASYSIAGNFAVLGLSNAWENKLFFGSAKKGVSAALEEGSKYVSAGENFGVRSAALENLGSIKSPLSRFRFYGEKAIEGTIAEGLWEENAQLVIQRMNTIDDNGNFQYANRGLLEFFKRLGTQTRDAFTGKDEEALESIGLGALIGIGAGTIMTKLQGERKNLIHEVQNALDYGTAAKNQLFKANDIYEKNADNEVVFDGNTPRVDPTKLAIKQQQIEKLFGSAALTNLQDFHTSQGAQFVTLNALASYVRSMADIGITNVAQRFGKLNPQMSAIFGIDNADVNKMAGKFGEMAKKFQEQSLKVNDMRLAPIPGLSPQQQELKAAAAKGKVYGWISDGHILSSFMADEESSLLNSLNNTRTLTNSSLSQYAVEQLNKLIMQKNANKSVMDSEDFKEFSDIEKKYHEDRATDLDKEIEQFKADNPLDAKELPNGFYKPLRPDGTPVSTLPSEIKSMQKLAEFGNMVHKNLHFANLLSDREDWYKNYTALKNTPAYQRLMDTINGAAAKIEKSPFAKYTEQKKGDFAKVTRIVAKLIAGEKNFSPEEMQVQQTYPQLVEELIPVYEKALENSRKEIIQSKIESLKVLRDAVSKKIEEQKEEINKLGATIAPESDLVTELILSIESNNTVNGEKIQRLINRTQNKLYKMQNAVDKLQDQVDDYNKRIETWGREVEESNVPELKKQLEDIREHKIYVELEIGDLKGALAKIRKLISDLIKIARRLIPGFSVKRYSQILEPSLNTYAEANREALAGSEPMAAYEEIRLKQDERDEIVSKLKALEKQFKDLSEKEEKYTKLTQEIARAALKEIEAQYLAVTQEVGKAPIVDQSEQSTTDSFGPFVTTPPSINSERPSEEGLYDGADYIRPLLTKFFTGTFSDERIKPFTEAEQNHFDLMDFLTNSLHAEEAKQKLGKGELKVIAVTQHNVDKLGLRNLIQNNEGNNLWDYEKDNVDLSAIALVHVVEEDGKWHYVDKNLNTLKAADKNIVFTLLRANRFKTNENSFTGVSEDGVYSIKYDDEQKKKALDAGHALREGIIEKSKDFDPENPSTLYKFTVSKGIPNKFENADKSPVKNSFVGILLTEDQIGPDSIFITTNTQKGTTTLNGQEITVPVGRAFVKTNAIFDQLHYADNNKIDSALANNILNVLSAMTKEYVKLAEEALAADLKGRTLAELEDSEKNTMMVKFNEMKIKHFDVDYLQYLNSVIQFGILKNGETPHPSKVYISGSKIYFGDKEVIDMTAPDDFLVSQRARDFLTLIYHNVAYLTKDSKKSEPYHEYYMDGEELKRREWKSYNHYLLMDKMPDGGKRDYIPVTTSIKTKAQQQISKGNNLPYKSQSVILNVPFVEGVVKKQVVNTNTTTTTSSRPVRMSAIPSDKRAAFEAKFNSFFVPAWVAEQEAQGATTAEDEAKTEQPTKEEVENAEGDTSTMDTASDDFDGEAFRVKTTGFFKTEDDLDDVINYVNKVLPQFPVQRLKQIIQTMDGREALGQFTGSVIKVWEGAEEGTLYHEAFEAVVNRLLKDYEWKAIEKEFKGRKGTFVDRETGEVTKYSAATPHQAKEEMAEEFREYKLTGKLPSEKNSRTFFQMILDFIKKYILGIPTLDSIFKNIDEGKFADRNVRGFNRFFSNYMVRRNLPIADDEYYDFLQGFTSLMFQDIFQTPQSLSNLDELGEIDETLYERVKSKVDAMYAELKKKTDALVTNHPTNKAQNELNKKRKEQFPHALAQWQLVKGDWGNFVVNHKNWLRKFRIKFQDEITDEDYELKNMNDYIGNSFKMNQKNSSSVSVRFLVGTLLKSRVEGVTMVANQVFPKIIRNSSPMFLPELENYDKMMHTVLDKLCELNREGLVKEKLREISGIKDIQDATSEKQVEVSKTMSTEQAALSLLYMRLFAPQSVVSPEAELNLRTKFMNYVSKQNPTPWIYMIDDEGDHNIIPSTSRPFYESFFKRMQSSIVHNITDIFEIKRMAGVKQYTSLLSKDEKFNMEDYISSKTAIGDTKVGKFLRFLGLIYKDASGQQVGLTPDFMRELSVNNKEQYDNLVNHLVKMRTAIIGHEFKGNINRRSINIFRYTNELVKLMEGILPQSEKTMTYNNGENELVQLYIPPSFVSRVMSELNNSLTLEQLTHENNYPHLARPFSSNSIVLNRMYKNGKRTNYSISMGYAEGIKVLSGEKFIKSSRMEEHHRLGMEFIMNLAGKYFTLPADSDTEWIFDFGEFVKFSNNMLENDKVIENFFIPQLRAEIQTALEFGKYAVTEQMNKTDDFLKDGSNYKIGQSLRFFKHMLSKDLTKKIHTQIAAKIEAEKIVMKNLAAIKKDIKAYIENRVDQTFANLVKNRIITKNGELFTMELTRDQKETYGENFTLSQMRNLIAYTVINGHIGNLEQFKLFFGDIAQYKDWEKRAKSLFSPIEQTYYDDDGYYNEWMNVNKNRAIFEGETVDIPVDDIFNTKFRNYATARTVDDFTVVDPRLVNLLRDLKIKFAQKYDVINGKKDTPETDGQSAGTLQYVRQLMLKSGWRWTQKMEDFFQYDTALARQELSEAGKYTYTSEELKALDAKIVEKFKNNPPKVGPSPLKTSMPSIRPDGTIDFVKHSVYAISYQLAKGREMLDVYLDMLKRGDDLLNFKSTHKVGAPIDASGKVTSFYKTENGSVNPFERTDLGDPKVGNVQYQLSFRSVGIQVETQSDEKGQTLSTQMTKDILLNLMPNGIPADFRAENAELSEQELYEKWSKSSIEDRVKSADYLKALKTLRSLENLKEVSFLTEFARLGVRWTVTDDGKVQYYAGDIKKLHDHILEQMHTLEIDENTIEGLQLKEDLNSFMNASETLPSYDVVNNIIWSIADRAINHMKVNGTPYIQVSSALFNSGPRGVAYKDEDGWHHVENREDYDRLVAEGKKMVMTSSDLKFYNLTEDGKTVTAMEVYLPHIYKEKVNLSRARKGLAPLSDEKLMEHLNKNPKLLEGVGFRIPTQAKSSMEFFIIKGFLPESFGKAIVVPSDITTKAGSDFDVDKLNTYLNNWKLGKNGMPEYEEFDNNMGERSIWKRYTNFINKYADKDIKNYIRALSKDERKAIFEDFDALAKEILEKVKTEKDGFFAQNFAEFKESLKDNKEMSLEDRQNQIDKIFAVGKRHFNGLTDKLKPLFWNLRDVMDEEDVRGPSRTMQFLSLASQLLDTATGRDITNLGEMIRMYNKELDVYRISKEKREQFVAAAKQYLKERNISTAEHYRNYTKEQFEEEGVDEDREGFLFELSVDVAKEIASHQGLPSLEDFAKYPAHLQNTKGAVENEYFDSIRDILQDGRRFDQLLSPNSMDNISYGKDAVFAARGVEDEESNTSNFLDINYLVRKRQAFSKGKYDIGIFAIGMTNFANSQVATIGVTDTIVDRSDYVKVMEWNNGDITLPFSTAVVIDVDGSPFMPLAPEKDVEGNYIMDNLSGYISGAVDVAKKPDIVDMGMHTELASTYLLLSRLRLDKETIALYMYQPAIREYLKELIFFKHQEFSPSIFDTISQLKELIVTKYSPKNVVYEHVNFDELQSEMISAIRKQELADQQGKIPAWSTAELRLQYLALVNFLKLKMYADDMSNNYRASNHDTSNIRTIWSIVMKDLSAKELREGNTIASAKGGELRNGIDGFREDTFIQRTIDLFNNATSIFSDVNLFALQKENPRNVLLQIAESLYDNTFFLPEKEFIRIMKEYEAGLIDTLLNNYTVTSEGHTIASYIDTFFKEGSKSNLYEQWEKVKRFGDVKSNLFLSSLQINMDEKLGVYTMGFNRNFAKDDILSRNLLTAGWRRMFRSPHEEVRKFAKALAMGSIIQFGVKNQRGTFTPLIPIEVYSQFSLAAMAQIDTADFSTLEEKIVRENSYKSGFIREEKTNAMEFLNGDGTLESKWRSNMKKPMKATDKVFMRKLSDAELAQGKKEYYNKPVFFWRGRIGDEEAVTGTPAPFKLMRAIRPEYVTQKLDWENQRWENVPKKEVFDMIKRKDFSWSYFQLYKLVGHDGNTPVIYKKKKITKGEHAGKYSLSYLYKPVNSAGYFNFNEGAVLNKDSYGNVSGRKSSLDIHYDIDEQPDTIIYEVVQKIKDKNSKIGYITTQINEPSGAILDDSDIDLGLSGISSAQKVIPSIEMQPDNILKIAAGTKTTTIRSSKQARAINIPIGQTEQRKIGGDVYNITNRGYLTIEEAGGMQAMLKSEGLTTVDALKYQQTKDWIEGKGRLYVYNISKVDNTISPEGKESIRPECD